MKILNINNYYHVRGGSERHYLDLGQLLIKHGHDVVWFSSKPPTGERPENAYFVEPINIYKPSFRDLFEFLYSKRASQMVQHIIDKEKPDIAHLHIYYGQLTTSILTPFKKAGIPVVQTLHDYKLICPANNLISHEKICEDCRGRFFWKAALKTCNRGSFPRSSLNVLEAYVSKANGSTALIDYFIAPSDFLRNKMIQYGLGPKKISTLHNFINIADYHPRSEQGEYFVYLGRLEKLKGVFVFLEAAAKLPSVPFLLIGGGEAADDIVDYINKHKLENVKLLGFKNKVEMCEIIKDAICVVVPSLCYEIFGLVILEAFAMAKPVVGSDIGGIPELINHGVDGFLVQPGNADDLAEKLSWLNNHPDEAAGMGSKGREKTETVFDAPIFYSKLMGIYKKFVK